MKCPNSSCNREIPNDAAFCPNCGTVIKPTGTNNGGSSFSSDNEYHFIPTTVAELMPFSTKEQVFFIALFILFILLAIPTIGITFILLLIFLFPLKFGARIFPKLFVHKKLCSMADYIQDPLLFRKERFILIKKDGKLGLFDQKMQKVQLNAAYDKLSWDLKDRTLDVQRDEKAFKIDIFGNILK